MNDRERTIHPSNRHTSCSYFGMNLLALGILIAMVQPALADAYFPCTGCSTQVSASTLSCLYSERGGYQADLKEGIGSKVFLTSCIKKINAAIDHVKNQQTTSANDTSVSTGSRPDSVSQVQLFSITEEDLRRLNSLDLRDLRDFDCDGCARAVLRLPVPATAGQPACPATTHPGCIWACDTDDPLDGIDDTCSTERWKCFGCGEDGETVCHPSPC